MDTPSSPPSPHVVGNLFVEQYYSILHHKPEEVYKFYKDSSVLSRPDRNGEMTSVTTTQTIDETIKSLDYGSYRVVIGTVDAQNSYKDGVIVLVTGCLTGKVNSLQKFTQTFLGCLTGEGNTLQKFTQTFFLAPQENGGYFVLNDVFRYVADSQPLELISIAASQAKEAAADTPVDSVPELAVVEASHEPDPMIVMAEENTEAIEEPKDTPGNEAPQVAATGSLVHNTPSKVEVIASEPEVQEDAPKKSYASIVKVVKASMSSSTVTAPAKTRVVRANSEKQAVPSAPAPPAEIAVPNSSSAHENTNLPDEGNIPDEVEGYSVYIRNLPLNATPSQLEAEFKKFGSIKPRGVQVRNHKQHDYCFGFVEFESLSSMQSALKASPILIAGRDAVVEEKRTTTRVGSGNGNITPGGRGRFSFSRGGFRNDSFRSRGGFGSGQGNGRNEFRSRGEFSNRGRGQSSRSGESYQRIGHPNAMTGISA